MTTDPTQPPVAAAVAEPPVLTPEAPVEPVAGLPVVPVPSGPKVYGTDLYAALNERLAEEASKTEGRVFDVFGKNFRLAPTMPMNAMLLMTELMATDGAAEIDPSVMGRGIRAFFHEDDAEAMWHHFTSHTFDDVFLGEFFQKVMEVMTARPTVRSDAS